MGSKARIAKHILPIILKDRKEGQWYVEPFVGGANMIDKVDGNRIGADVNPYLIEALKLIRDNPELIPKNNSEYTKEMRDKAILSDSHDPVDCLMYFATSFCARFKASFALGHANEDFVRAARNNAKKQSPLIQGVELICSSYDTLEIPTQSTIYCDPPYAGTTKYKDDFDHDKFWQWCREKCKEGHNVFVSEYNAPDDFVCVWQQELNVTVARNGKHKKAIEKLFVHESQVGSC